MDTQELKDLEMVKQNGMKLKNVVNQTPKICLEAVKQDGLALEYVKKQTPDICLAAVKESGYALQYVKDQTPEICLAAVKEDGDALMYVKDQTPDICLAAVKQRGYALDYVEEQTLDICLAAVKQHGLALDYVKEQTLEICLAAVKQDGEALAYVKEQTPEICLAASMNDKDCLNYINIKILKDIFKNLSYQHDKYYKLYEVLNLKHKEMMKHRKKSFGVTQFSVEDKILLDNLEVVDTSIFHFFEKKVPFVEGTDIRILKLLLKTSIDNALKIQKLLTAWQLLKNKLKLKHIDIELYIYDKQAYSVVNKDTTSIPQDTSDITIIQISDDNLIMFGDALD